MTCEIKRSGDVMIVACSRGRGRGPTYYCVACLASGVKTPAPLLCDWPLNSHVVTHGRTCDKAMCREHARSVRPGVDYCRDHTGEPG